MRRRWFLGIISVFLIWTVALSAQSSVRLIPAKPKQGKLVTIKYKPNQQLAPVTKLYAYVYLFTEPDGIPRVEVSELRRAGGGEFEGTVQLKPSDVFGMIKITDGGELVDDNQKRFWDFLVTADFVHPVQGAHYRRGYSFLGSLPEPCKRQVNYDSARAAFQRELQQSPNYLPAQVGLLWLKQVLGEISPSQFEKEFRALLEQFQDYSQPHFLLTAIRGWQMLRNPEKVKELEQILLAQFPESEAAKEVKFQRLMAVTDPSQFLREATLFLQRYPAYRRGEELERNIVTRYLRRGEYDTVAAFLQRIPSPHPQSYIMLTRFLLGQYQMMTDTIEQRKLRDRLAEVANLMREYVEQDLLSLKPPYLAPSEWEKQMTTVRAEAFYTYGLVQEAFGNLEQAMEAYQQALMWYDMEDVPADLYDHLIPLLIRFGHSKDAFLFIQQAIVTGKASDSIQKQLRPLYDSLVGKGDEGFRELEQHLEQEKKSYRKMQLFKKRLNQPMVDGELTTLDGKKVRLSDFKGKILILDFWATWCGPCKASFPVLQRLYDSLKNDKDIAFLVINVWERVDNRDSIVKAFLKQTNYTFPVYLDKKDALIRKYGITGIPTKVYIDKKGRIQFKEIGFMGAQRSREFFLDVLELLRDPAFYRQ